MSTQYLSQNAFQQENINLRCNNAIFQDIDCNGNIEVQDYVTVEGNITSTSGQIIAQSMFASGNITTPSMEVESVLNTPVTLVTQLTSPTTPIPSFNSLGFIITTFESSLASLANFKFTINNLNLSSTALTFANVIDINTNNTASVLLTNRQADSVDCIVCNNGSAAWNNTVVKIAFFSVEPSPP